jgi:4-hydroxythreonine-4-phosphate dehydrogenase
MIHISQGHEKSISFEIFFNCISLLSQKDVSNILFHVEEKSLIQFLKDYKIKANLDDHALQIYNKTLPIKKIVRGNLPISTLSLESALSSIQNDVDMLVTLPTSKDQLIHEGQLCLGHTEYFRKRFNDDGISMVFKNKKQYSALLTDHIPLSRVSGALEEAFINKKILITLNGLEKYFSLPEEIYFSGVNPHAGEGGLLGDTEAILESSILKLKETATQIKILGPLPGDTMHFYRKDNTLQLNIYAYHDQALAPFKDRYGIFGLNISFGLPFLRLSVDHGTAFNLYGKNQANYFGLYYLLIEALKVQRTLNGN